MTKMYAKIDEKTKRVSVGIGTNIAFYRSIGMSEMDVEQAYDGQWYLKGYAPEEPAPTKEEQSAKRAAAYLVEIDPITAQIQRLRDETEPDKEKIAALIAERAAKVAEIKALYPYPAEPAESEAENA